MHKTIFWKGIFLMLFPFFIFSSFKKSIDHQFPTVQIKNIDCLPTELVSHITKYLPSTEREKMSVLSKSLYSKIEPLRKIRIKKAFKNSLLYPHLNKYSDWTEKLSYIVKEEHYKNLFSALFFKYGPIEYVNKDFANSLNLNYQMDTVFSPTTTKKGIEVEKVTFKNRPEKYKNTSIDLLYVFTVNDAKRKLIRKTVEHLGGCEFNKARIIFKEEMRSYDQNQVRPFLDMLKIIFEEIDYYNKNNKNLYEKIKIIDFSHILSHVERCCGKSYSSCVDELKSILPLFKDMYYFVPILTYGHLFNKKQTNKFLPFPVALNNSYSKLPALTTLNLPSFTSRLIRKLNGFECGLGLNYALLDLETRFVLFSLLLKSASPFTRFSYPEINYNNGELLEVLLSFMNDCERDNKIVLKEKAENLFISTIKFHEYGAKYWYNLEGDSLLHILLKNVYRIKTQGERFTGMKNTYMSQNIVDCILSLDIDIHRENFRGDTPLFLLLSKMVGDQELFVRVLDNFFEKITDKDVEKIIHINGRNCLSINMIIHQLGLTCSADSLNLLIRIIKRYPQYFRKYNADTHNNVLRMCFNPSIAENDIFSRFNFIKYLLNENMIENINDDGPLNQFILFISTLDNNYNFDDVFNDCQKIVNMMLEKGADCSPAITKIISIIDYGMPSAKNRILLLKILEQLIKKKIPPRPW